LAPRKKKQSRSSFNPSRSPIRGSTAYRWVGRSDRFFPGTGKWVWCLIYGA
jgi:hypothetical protein